MKIRSQFVLTTAVFIVLLAALFGSWMLTNRRVTRLQQQEKIALKIERAASELSFLTNDVLLTRDSRSRARWEAVLAAISSELAQMEPETEELRRLVNVILAGQHRLTSVYSILAVSLEDSPTQNTLDLPFIQDAWTRLENENQSILYNASLLAELLREQADQVHQTNLFLTYILVGLFSIYMIANFQMVYRRLLKALAQLQMGAGLVGAGSLDFTIPEQADDEIGDLAAAFNRMTSSLAATMASKEDLETEIAERSRAEAALQDRNARLALLSRASSRLMEGDDPSTLLKELHPELASLFEVDIYVQYGLAEDRTHLRLTDSGGLPEAMPAPELLELGEGVCGLAAYTRRVHQFENLQQLSDERTQRLRDLGLQSFVCFPLQVRDRLVGILGFGGSSQPTLSDDALHSLRSISDLLAVAIERNQNEQRLRDYSHRLERSNAELEDFAYVASHDLQEPLRKVKSFGERLRDELASSLGEEESDLLNRMLQATLRMQEMIGDLLNLSRITTQGHPFRPVDLNRVLDDVVSDLELSLHRTQGRVETDTLPTVFADPYQMNSLFLNLVGNALKYHHPEVAPLIRVHMVKPGHLPGRGEIKWLGENPQIDSRPSTAFVVLAVEDNGIGFDMQKVEQIFQPFQRLHGRSAYPGTGIGLAICKKIVERHGGAISALSTPGQGSTFLVMLPVRPVR